MKKSEPMTVRLDADVLDALRKRAEDDDRSVSWLVNWAIRVAFKIDQPKRSAKSK